MIGFGPRQERLGWHRTVTTGFAILFILLGIWSAIDNVANPSGADFLSFWAAGRLVLQGHPALAYDIAAHGSVENLVAHIGGRMPFPYPPPFLAVVTPFAVPGFGMGFLLWVGITAAFFAFASSRTAPLAFAFGNGPACIDFMIGQNGFLTGGIFLLGISLISSAPFAAGAVLGLMILKPQLALLLPVATLAGREWRVIAAAIVSATAMLLLGLLLFGAQSYVGFWNILPYYVELIRDSRLPWNELASPFALARYIGIPNGPAIALHIAIALAATVVAARAWWLKLESRVPILAAATLLIPPYLFTYDALLIVVPLGWLFKNRKHPFVIFFAWTCCFIPITTYFSPWVAPNLISIAAMASLWALHERAPAIVASSRSAESPARI